MAPTKKALVLSGGGGRGAYHIGVIEELVRQGWMADGQGPDIIAGTSIGAINAAALASGLTVAQLKDRWLAMHTEEVHRLSNDLPAAARPLLSFILRSVLTSDVHGGARATLPDEERGLSAEGLFSRLSKLFHASPFRSLLDTSPWRQTLSGWMDFERINSPAAPALLLVATELQTGALRIFCNRSLNGRSPDEIVLDHLMASSSIPIVYPWTEIGDAKYWDGAVLANTPLEPVIDLAGDEDVDVVVVMMTPWHATESEMRSQTRQMPRDLVQALSLTLDWTLLASYRVAFEMLEHRNALADAAEKLERAAQQMGDASMRLAGPSFRRITPPMVIAPQELMPLDWIIDYEDANHLALFERGRADAARALAQR
jgi:NTE family protein